MYKHILVPVALDHEHNAAQALEIAQSLRAEGGRITVLHVLEAVPGYVETYIPEEVRKNNQAEAKASLDGMTIGVSGPIETHVILGHSGRSIVEYSKAHDNDCIVMASHRPGLQDYFLGSTAGHVVRHATCGVHVVR